MMLQILIPKGSMMARELSRGPTLNMEKIITNAGGNKYDMILIAAAKGREIARKHLHSRSTEYCSPSVQALLDLQNTKVE